MNPKIICSYFLALTVNCAVTNKKQISTETKINSSLGSSIDVRVEGIVPRHQCRRALRNLEVSFCRSLARDVPAVTLFIEQM